MDRDILKSIVAFLITAAAILGPTLLEWIKRRMKADIRRNTPVPPQLSRMNKKAAELSSATKAKPADHREAMHRASEKETARVFPEADSMAPPMSTEPEAPTPQKTAPAPTPVNSRAAALRRAVIAAEVLQRKF